MDNTQSNQHPVLGRMVGELQKELGHRLQSVVLYGSAARGDFQKKTSDLNVLIVVERLDPETLEALSRPVLHWERRGQPAPRYFTPAMISDAADVFPIEFLDIERNRVVIFGEDPLRDLEIDPAHLRLQCERELREKLMRLREAYIEAHRKPRELARLLTDSFTTFVALFRGCLHLLGEEIPVHNSEVVTAFCNRAGLDRAPFDEIDRLKRSADVRSDPKSLFSGYYEQLTRAVEAIDRFASEEGES